VPHLAGLRGQVIHNDAGAHNVLVDPHCPGRVAGIIDFGDLLHASLAQDLAASIGDMLFTASDPLESAAAMAAWLQRSDPPGG
jgi:Ser/Thr protein kinase RdoA (MazF antagonist)